MTFVDLVHIPIVQPRLVWFSLYNPERDFDPEVKIHKKAKKSIRKRVVGWWEDHDFLGVSLGDTWPKCPLWIHQLGWYIWHHIGWGTYKSNQSDSYRWGPVCKRWRETCEASTYPSAINLWPSCAKGHTNLEAKNNSFEFCSGGIFFRHILVAWEEEEEKKGWPEQPHQGWGCGWCHANHYGFHNVGMFCSSPSLFSIFCCSCCIYCSLHGCSYFSHYLAIPSF